MSDLRKSWLQPAFLNLPRSDPFAGLALMMLKAMRLNAAKGSDRGKFKKAGWSHDFLKSLIQGF
jgi:hypothetical protein